MPHPISFRSICSTPADGRGAGLPPAAAPRRRRFDLHWLVTAPVAVAVVVFALSNRTPVRLSFWPFALSVEAPLALVVLGVAALAFLAGAFLAALAGWRASRRARRLEAELARLHQEVLALRQRQTESGVAVLPPPRP